MKITFDLSVTCTATIDPEDAARMTRDQAIETAIDAAVSSISPRCDMNIGPTPDSWVTVEIEATDMGMDRQDVEVEE